jgi:hypothetical protein
MEMTKRLRDYILKSSVVDDIVETPTVNERGNRCFRIVIFVVPSFLRQNSELRYSPILQMAQF